MLGARRSGKSAVYSQLSGIDSLLIVEGARFEFSRKIKTQLVLILFDVIEHVAPKDPCLQDLTRLLWNTEILSSEGKEVLISCWMNVIKPIVDLSGDRRTMF